MADGKQVRVSQWYFGGLASAGAACITHPLDLLKVQMQTQKGKNISMFQLTQIVLKNQGIFFFIMCNKYFESEICLLLLLLYTLYKNLSV